MKKAVEKTLKGVRNCCGGGVAAFTLTWEGLAENAILPNTGRSKEQALLCSENIELAYVAERSRR